MGEYPITGEPTPFQEIYDSFLANITDDLYLNKESDFIGGWTREDTINDLKNILIVSIPGFEFPRFPLYDFNEEKETYNCHLTREEVMILGILMYNTWLQRQIASVENIRMKYAGTEFSMSSQANHLSKLKELKTEAERLSIHYQRLYKRRKIIDNKGSIKSNWSTLMERSTFDD